MSEVVAIEYDVNIGGNGIVITYYADGTYSIAGLSLSSVSDEHREAKTAEQAEGL